MTLIPLQTVPIETENDIVDARLVSRALAKELGFSPSDQTLIATAISEIARNTLVYAKKGVITLAENASPHGIVIIAEDKGPGILNIEDAMRDGYSSGGGLGLGLPGARRLMDFFEIRTAPGEGTVITMKKYIGSHGMGFR